ncbi:MAG: ATP-binding cassette domain-containing protein [Lachnospiraceae bacterium]|nr:ATP-binding cassette domain-containing protein [Lachnospiraceae bacterium]
MLFEVRNISKSFKKIPVVENFSLEVEQGDMIALVGKRRHGKTTLMQMLAGIISVDEGEIYYDGKLVGSKGRTSGLCKLRRGKIGYITTEAILMPDMTVYDNLLMAMSHKWGSTKTKKSRAKEVLRNLGLKGKGRFFPKELSVLDKQKVCVARAIINEPELLICDEPTDILEGYGAEQMMDILEILNSAGYSIILSTHSKRVASRCRKVYPVHEGLDLTGLAVVNTGEEAEKEAMEETAASEVNEGEPDDNSSVETVGVSDEHTSENVADVPYENVLEGTETVMAEEVIPIDEEEERLAVSENTEEGKTEDLKENKTEDDNGEKASENSDMSEISDNEGKQEEDLPEIDFTGIF